MVLSALGEIFSSKLPSPYLCFPRSSTQTVFGPKYLLPLDISKLICDRIVRLPYPVHQFHRRASLTLVVHDLGPETHAAPLRADAPLLAPLLATVVVVGGHIGLQRVPAMLSRAHVEPLHISAVLIDRLNPLCNPVVQEFRSRRHALVRNAIEIRPLRVILIAAGKWRDEIEVIGSGASEDPRLQPSLSEAP